MKATNKAYANRYQGSGTDSRLTGISFGISIAVHLVFLGTLIFMPQSGSGNRFSSSVVNVSLVSMPGKAPAAGPPAAPVAPAPKKEAPKPAKAKIPKITPPPQKPVVAVQKPKDVVSLKAKPKKKASLKKKTLDRSKIVKGAIEDVQKKVEDKNSASLNQALSRLKKQVNETEAAAPQPYTPDKAQTSKAGAGSGGLSGSGGGGLSGSGGPRTLEAIKIYQAEIQYQIQKNWAFSQQLAGQSRDLEAVLAIKILRNGEIQDIWFDQRSGNEYLDDSAHKALVKSNPLPPLPVEYIGSHYKIGLIFGPKGLK
jgi:colicin import membrane protein